MKKVFIVLAIVLAASVVHAAGSFTTAGGNTTVTLTYVTATTKMLDTLTNAAHAMWNLGYGDHSVTFDALTNQQKVDVIDAYVRATVVDLSKKYYVNGSISTTVGTASTYADTNLGF